MIVMDEKQYKIFLEARLRNLKRKAAKMADVPSLTTEYFEVEKEIHSTENELKLM